MAPAAASLDVLTPVTSADDEEEEMLVNQHQHQHQHQQQHQRQHQRQQRNNKSRNKNYDSEDDELSGCTMELDLLEMASIEIERMRRTPHEEGRRQSPPRDPSSPPLSVSVSSTTTTSSSSSSALEQMTYHKFPPACLAILQHMKGNQRCVDCGARNPQWAAVSYGALLCLHCSGHHRSLGVQVSCVRSITMDEWSIPQILNMLEGGNNQLVDFFSRHLLCRDSLTEQEPTQAKVVITKNNVMRLRYKTKAAQFYHQQMALHTAQILTSKAPYRGRSRRQRSTNKKVLKRQSTIE